MINSNSNFTPPNSKLDVANGADSRAVASLGEAIVKCFRNYINFEGRANRPEFWYFFLFNVLMIGALYFFGSLIFKMPIGIWASDFWFLITLIPTLAVGVRRLHDTNRTGWWIFIGLIPIIGFVVLIILFTLKSVNDGNRFN